MLIWFSIVRLFTCVCLHKRLLSVHSVYDVSVFIFDMCVYIIVFFLESHICSKASSDVRILWSSYFLSFTSKFSLLLLNVLFVCRENVKQLTGKGWLYNWSSFFWNEDRILWSSFSEMKLFFINLQQFHD
jgi:hypothetical protein